MAPDSINADSLAVIAEMERVYAAFATRMIEILDRQERIENNLADFHRDIVALRGESVSKKKSPARLVAEEHERQDIGNALSSIREVLKRHAVEIAEAVRRAKQVSEVQSGIASKLGELGSLLEESQEHANTLSVQVAHVQKKIEHLDQRLTRLEASVAATEGRA